ncbi:MAG: YqaE/Pmp3 family membrane protein [Bacteroidia bacterium]
MKKLNAFLLLASAFLLASCATEHSIVKRHYNKGYYVDHIATVHNTAPETREEPGITAVAVPITAQVIETEQKKEAAVRKDEQQQSETAATASISKKSKAPVKEKETELTDKKDVGNNVPVITPAAKKVARTYTEKNREGDSMGDPLMMILLILLCVIIPPLAVFIKTEEVAKPFVIDLIFWILGLGLGIGLGGLAWLCMIISIVYAFYICFFK